MDETSTTPRLSLTTLSGDRGEEEKVDEIDAFKGSPETDERERHRGGAADGQTTQRDLPDWKSHVYILMSE